jgi:hypothetical protein
MHIWEIPDNGELENIVAHNSSSSVQYMVAKALLAARAGESGTAKRYLHGATGDRSGILASDTDLVGYGFQAAILSKDLTGAAALLNAACGSDDLFRISLSDDDDDFHTDIAKWTIKCVRRSELTFSHRLTEYEFLSFIAARIAETIPILATYHRFKDLLVGSVYINLGDTGEMPGLAFCDNRSEYFLIPDTTFIQFRGYWQTRSAVVAQQEPWNERVALALWRGSTTGVPEDPSLGWRSLPRIRLCEIGRSHRDLFDVGITDIVQRDDAKTAQEINASGLMCNFMDPTNYSKYKFQIDIDGYSNSWARGLFPKLLTASPVLKIASPHGYRQWYYDRLKPWENFVPVASDMSDLVEKVRWLKDHDRTAARIGKQGQKLALSLNYADELKRAGHTISAAIRYFQSR